MSETSIAVVGGGIAGISAAYYLAKHQSSPKVTLIEKETTLKYHTSGRSIAQLDFGYGHPSIQALTKRSLEIFESIAQSRPEVLATQPMLCLALDTDDDEAADEVLRDFPGSSEISVSSAVEMFKYLKADSLNRVVLAPRSYTLDVDVLFDFFRTGFIDAGGAVETTTRLDSARPNEQQGRRWIIETSRGPIEADVVVNAAGAWGDEVASASGIEPIGLKSYRRTIVSIPNPFDIQGEAGNLPPMLTRTTFKHWYLKIAGDQVYCSPSEEVLAEPGDPKPTLEDVELTKERVEAVVDGISIEPELAIEHSWVGLRTFAEDRLIVIGPDDADETFVWYVGQGGNGIQAAPASAELLASLLLDGGPSDAHKQHQIDPLALSVSRFRK